MTQIEKDLKSILQKNNVKVDEPMSKHTSFKVGGKADYFVIVETQAELRKLLNYTNKNNIKLTLIGNGTNCLICDEGIRGIVAVINFKDYKITRYKNYARITVGSGLAVCILSNIALKEELADLEFLCGIPGTVGGAIYMNAGAFGSEMKDIVVSTKYMDRLGNVHKIKNNEHNFGYRYSMFKDNDFIIFETELKVGYSTKDKIKSKIEEMTKKRVDTQPYDLPSAGSTFRRNDKIITAQIIDECGLKGYTIGGAEVSTKHAGFIVNKGNATCEDIIKLINYIKDKVYEKTKVKIEEEIIILGGKE